VLKSLVVVEGKRERIQREELLEPTPPNDLEKGHKHLPFVEELIHPPHNLPLSFREMGAMVMRKKKGLGHTQQAR
jgi:hypothetical protein